MTDEAVPQKRKTIVKTFRLPEDLVSSLEREADEEGTTLSALVATILLQHREWGHTADKLGIISVSKGVLLSALESADDVKLATTARKLVPPNWRDMAMFRFHSFSMDNLVQLFSLITRYGHSANMDVKKEGKRYLMTIRHPLGPRFSILIGNAIDETLRSEFHVQPSIQYGEASVVIEFPEQ